MQARLRLAVLMSVVTVVVSGAVVAAKPELAPVRIEYEAPPPAKVGDQVTAVLTLRALAGVDRVVVNVAPSRGLDLVSDGAEVAFTDLKAGDTRQLTVTIRLTDEKAGYLGVSYRTHQGKRIAGGATTVIFRGTGA